MIDVKLLRDNPELIRASQKARGESTSLVDDVLKADEERRRAIVEFEALRAEQNALSKSVGAAKGDEKSALLEKAKSLSIQVK
ncbi:MAG: serine--tRNA ligase, partial [Actinomycetota bacterium]